ncbi:hypothetical protein FOCC_FOCC000569 [Frankliniella occidentalis]|nr:hypothetical protein FOCC_FOCC000569 [Frankliniella occidentalis]
MMMTRCCLQPDLELLWCSLPKPSTPRRWCTQSLWYGIPLTPRLQFLGGTRPGSADDDKIRQLFQSAINYSIPKDNYAQVEIIPQKFQFLSK